MHLRRPPVSLGLDFGTTRSRIALIDHEKKYAFPHKWIEPIRTVVYPEPSEGGRWPIVWWAGDEALMQVGAQDRFKLKIDEILCITTPTVEGPQTIAYPAPVLAARIMHLLRRAAIRFDERVKDIFDIAVTVPAEWTFPARAGTILAARIAGFQNVAVLEEPVAAFLALYEEQGDKIGSAGTILVFDCGGGTLDCSVIRKEGTQLPLVLARSMEARSVAGEFLDEDLTHVLLGEALWEELDDGERRYAQDKVRELKERLNPKELGERPRSREESPEPLNYGKVRIRAGQLALTRDQMEEVVRKRLPLVERTVERALAGARLTRKKIECIIMVGGSSYLRPYQRLLEEMFAPLSLGEEIFLYKPEELVSLGAALYQSSLDIGEERFTPTLSLDTFVEYERKVAGDSGLKSERFYLGRAGHRLPRPRSRLTPARYLPVPGPDIDWPVVQERTAPDGRITASEAIERVRFRSIRLPAINLVRLAYRIGRGGYLTRWRPALVLQPKRRPEEVEERLPEESMGDPRELRQHFGVEAPGPGEAHRGDG